MTLPIGCLTVRCRTVVFEQTELAREHPDRRENRITKSICQDLWPSAIALKKSLISGILSAKRSKLAVETAVKPMVARETVGLA